MNKNIAKYFLTLATIAIASVGCEVNDFNDRLDGFEGNKAPENIQIVPVTLSLSDYSAIASNKDNIALAASMGPDAVAALKSIGDNKFIDADDTQLYLPAYLSATYPQLDNGSAVQVSFVHKTNSSTIIEKSLENQYKLEDADYNGAWGANHDTPFFTKAKPAEQFIPDVLKAKLTGAKADDYAVVNYNFSQAEPTPAVSAFSAPASTPATRAVTVKKIADIKFADKEVATAEGTVIALHAQGVLIEDNTGKAFFFNGKETFHSLGDVIQVTGATEVRNGVNQFSKGGSSLFISHPAGAFAYPETATTIDKDNIAAYNTACGYVKMVGELIVDGNYLNLTIDGITTYRGSIQYAFAGLDFPSYNGKQIEITGYYLGNSGSSTKNFSVAVTTLKEVGSAVDVTATGIVATKAGTYTSKGIVVATYDKGFMMNDGTGNVIVYQNKTSTVTEGDFVTVTGESELRFSMGQFKNTATVTAAADKKAVTRPEPFVFAGADIDAYMTAPIYRYVTFEGKLKKNGNFYEVHGIAGTAKYGSFSNPLAAQKTELDKLNGKTIKVTGYLIGSNTGTGYFSVLYGNVEHIISFETEERSGVFSYDGSTWTAVDKNLAIVVNEADYKAMGLSNMYFDKNKAADKYLYSFLNNSFAYPQIDQYVTVLYNYKESGDPYMMGGSYTFDGAEWTQSYTMEQYVKLKGKWQFNPSLTLVVNPDKSLFSQKHYQAAIDYVIANKHVAYTTKDDKRLTNSEFYSGCAADYTNLNWRINTLPWYYWKVAEGDEAVKKYEDYNSIDITKKKAAYEEFYKVAAERFGESMGAGLSKLYPSAKPLSGIDVTYTVQMMIYTQHIASNTGRVTHAFEFKVVDAGKFEYVKMYALDAKYELMKDDNFK